MASREVQEAIGEAPERDNRSKLETRAAELRRIVERPSEKERAAEELAAIERKIAESREHDARAKAEARIVGIRRALGSVTSSMDADEKRLREAVAAVEEAITRLNDRYTQAAQLRAEAAALCDRFGIPDPKLPTVTAPALRRIDVTPSVRLLDQAHARPRTERCEHQLRERRTYAEIAGTPAYEIIETAGLKEFPPLTPKQQRILEERAREEAEVRRQFAGLPAIPEGLRFSGSL